MFMVRPPPILSLFPYTTLFRSHRPAGVAGGRRRLRHVRVRALQREIRRDRCVQGTTRPAAADRGRREDRKSTRLNSSHLGSSYAVFCLKKKKQYILSLYHYLNV